MGEAYCARKTLLQTRSFPLLKGDSTASFITWVGGLLTVAHVVPKRLLVARELNSKLGIPSEPRTELIPSIFGVEMWAILVVWAIQ